MSYAQTMDTVSTIFATATTDVLRANTQEAIHFAPTIQIIPRIRLKPDIGCFVQFSGDYSGLLIVNFSREAAMAYYHGSMLLMGMPESELAKDYTSDEVVNYIGEAVNQLIGKARLLMQERYGLSARNSPPKAICLIDSLSLSIEGPQVSESQCRRLSFMLAEKYSFSLEFFLEPTEFVLLPEEVVS